jgi:ABC-2 type transport system ATP-binding protein
MTTAMILENVTKQFKLSNSSGIKQLTINAVKGRRRVNSFTAVDNVSFKLNVGDSIGLLGLNGSGKSTLLKLISGVMQPTSGKVLTRGRVAGLIEVGAGFHSDLTGRENIFLNGAILGMSQQEIKRKFDAIVDFSEMENFIDGQVGNYSSGMFMRLAFAVAVHTDCDIFLMDEMLAVGDQPFKRKCIRRIHALKEEGKTMFFVSHNTKQVMKLCDLGMVLQAGQLAYYGTSTDAVKFLGFEEDEDIDD